MKFSIRDLLLVTVIVALAVGWWAERRDRERQKAKFNEQLHKLTMDTDAYKIEIAIGAAAERRVRTTMSKLQTQLIMTEVDVKVLEAELQKARAESKGLPNSSAPALNPPKP